MKKMVLAGAALAAMMMVGGSASASTFLKLTNDQCTGTCGLSGGASYGEIQVDGLGTNVVTFDVKLATDIFFNMAGGAKPEMFTLTNGAPSAGSAIPFPNAPQLTFSNVTTGFSPGNGGTENAGDHSSIGAWGDFAYTIGWVGPPNNNGGLSLNPPVGVQELKFTVTAAAGTQLQLDPDFTTKKVGSGRDKTTVLDGFGDTLFIADLYGANGKTGYVGAVLDTSVHPQGGVPEPASWALMLLGFGGLGSMLRQRRAARAVAA